jgi:hypothetical protein
MFLDGQDWEEHTFLLSSAKTIDDLEIIRAVLSVSFTRSIKVPFNTYQFYRPDNAVQLFVESEYYDKRKFILSILSKNGKGDEAEDEFRGLLETYEAIPLSCSNWLRKFNLNSRESLDNFLYYFQ